MSRKKDIYQNLHYRIITNELNAGQQLLEKELMQEYNIGRTPLREIFKDLQRDGLIEIIPNLGTRVVSMDIQTLREVVQVRRNLESLAAELAVTNITPEQLSRLRHILDEAFREREESKRALAELSDLDMQFHKTIYAASGNTLLKEMVESLLDRMTMYWFQAGFSAEEFRDHFDDFKELLHAIEEKDGSKAKASMTRHIDYFISLLRKNIV